MVLCFTTDFDIPKQDVTSLAGYPLVEIAGSREVFLYRRCGLAAAMKP
jgi:hypothetical protein